METLRSNISAVAVFVVCASLVLDKIGSKIHLRVCVMSLPVRYIITRFAILRVVP